MRRAVLLGAGAVLLVAVLALAAPGFLTAGNLREIAVANAPLLLVATGMTLVILLGEIDVSAGAQFACLSVLTGLLAREGWPWPVLLPVVLLAGAGIGLINGVLVARCGVPSIVATLAAMGVLREGLRWSTGGAWVQDLPATFQWFGLPQRAGEAVLVAVAVTVLAAGAVALRHVVAGRFVYAVGSDREAARLAGVDHRRVVPVVFGLLGMLTALAAALNTARFTEVPANAGLGMELQAISAVVVGGTAITGGRGGLWGTLGGVVLLALLGPALPFLGVEAAWERAVQGLIILIAAASSLPRRRQVAHA